IWVPIIRLSAKEPVITVETLLQRPLLAGRAGRNIFFRHVVILAQPERAISVRLQHLPYRGAKFWCTSVRARESVRRFGNARASVDMMIAACQKRRASRRTQSRCMPLRIPQAIVSEPLQRRHIDLSAERRPARQSCIVEQDNEHVWCSFWSLRLLVRRPICLR